MNWQKCCSLILVLVLLTSVLTGCNFNIGKKQGDIKVGDLVEVEWEGEWWNAIVLEIKKGEYLVTYKGFSTEWDEWVDSTRIKLKVIPGKADSQGAAYQVGEVLMVHWHRNWWKAEILKTVVDRFYFVDYEGFDSEWNEWVHGDRIKDYAKKGPLEPGSTCEIPWDGEYWPATVLEVKEERFYFVMFYGESTLTEEWVEEYRIWDGEGDAPYIGGNADFEIPDEYLSALGKAAPNDEGLQFTVEHRNGLRGYYYGNDLYDLTHLIVENNGQFRSAIIFNGDMYPIHWLYPNLTIAAVGTGESPFNPAAAEFKVVYGGTISSIVLNVEMSEQVVDVLEKLPVIFGDELAESVEDLKEQADAMDWLYISVEEVIGQVGSTHDLAFVSFLATASVTGKIIEYLADQQGSLGSHTASASSINDGAQIFIPLATWGDVGDAALKAALGSPAGNILDIGNYLRRIARGDYDGPATGPTVGMLLCRGASTAPNVCNEFYLYHNNENLGYCVQICVATLGCFTDICHPIILSVEEANGFRTIR